jgi:hypothetical protein
MSTKTPTFDVQNSHKKFEKIFITQINLFILHRINRAIKLYH